MVWELAVIGPRWDAWVTPAGQAGLGSRPRFQRAPAALQGWPRVTDRSFVCTVPIFQEQSSLVSKSGELIAGCPGHKG